MQIGATSVKRIEYSQINKYRRCEQMRSNTVTYILAEYGIFFSNQVKVTEFYKVANSTVVTIKRNMHVLAAW